MILKWLYYRFKYGKYGKPFTVEEIATHLDKMKHIYPDKVDKIERLKSYFENREWQLNDRRKDQNSLE